MPDYGPMPKVKRVDFGIAGPTPKVKEVEEFLAQSYREAELMIDVGLWVGEIAEKQALKTGRKRGLKGMPLTRFASEMSNEAANDAMEWVKEEFADWGVQQLREDREN